MLAARPVSGQRRASANGKLTQFVLRGAPQTCAAFWHPRKCWPNTSDLWRAGTGAALGDRAHRLGQRRGIAAIEGCRPSARHVRPRRRWLRSAVQVCTDASSSGRPRYSPVSRSRRNLLTSSTASSSRPSPVRVECSPARTGVRVRSVKAPRNKSAADASFAGGDKRSPSNR